MSDIDISLESYLLGFRSNPLDIQHVLSTVPDTLAAIAGYTDATFLESVPTR
jgi:hypothetical protein